MKILLVNEYHISMLAGGERWIIEISKRLTRKRCRIYLLMGFKGLRLDARHAIYKTLSLNNVMTFESKMPDIPFICSLSYAALRSIVSRIEPDIVYLVYSGPKVLNTISYILPSSVVVGLHQPLYLRSRARVSHIIYDKLGNIMISLYFPILCHKIVFHAINKDDYIMLRKRRLRVFYVPNGVDTKKLIPRRKFDTFTILYIGSRWQKGTDFVPYIVDKMVRLTRGDVRFVLVGGIGQIKFKKLLQNLSNQFPRNIEYIKYVSDEELRELLARSHVLMFPSRYEAFGTLVLEALSCGTPVVAFNTKGAPQDVIINEYNGFLAERFDLNDFVNKLLVIYLEWIKGKYNEIGKNARTSVLKFDWNIIAERFYGKLQELLW